MRNDLAYIPFFFALLLAGCAQVRSISGGEKDTDPPLIIAANPDTNSLQFSGNSFTLYFNEYIQLRDLQKELLVSPPLKSTPRVKVKQRSLEVSWDDTLRSETTYIFQFGKAIADINESNALNDLSYVFSTGAQLDSLTCKGRVTDAFTDKPFNTAKVFLFDSLQHVFNPQARPAYFSRTNEKGEFRLNFLRQGRFVLCAMSDENGNNHFDIGESIDWKENIATTQDSVTHLLFTSIPRDTSVRSFNYLADSSGVLKFHLNPWEQNTRVISLSDDPILQWTQADTLYATGYAMCNKKLDVEVLRDEKIIDTLSIQHIGDEIDAMKAAALFNPKMTPGDSLVIQTNRPTIRFDDAFLKCLADSAEIPCSSIQINAIQRQIRFEEKPGKTYSIQALPGWLTDDCGETNDTLNVNFSFYVPKELGSLRFKLSGEVLTSPHTFQLLDRTKKTVYELKRIYASEWTVDHLVPGDYTAIICNDTNGNGFFDPLQINRYQPTERNHTYGPAIQVRANWEVVIDWSIPEQ
jgi:uncharacterized protein (DUF2141 family)